MEISTPRIVSVARRGDLDAVEDIVEVAEGSSREEKRMVANAAAVFEGLHYDTALHAAAKCGQADVVRFLLSDCLVDPTLESASVGGAVTAAEVACTEIGAAANPKSLLGLSARIGHRASIGIGSQTDWGALPPSACARALLARAAAARTTHALIAAAMPYWTSCAASDVAAATREFAAPPEFRALRRALAAVQVEAVDPVAVAALAASIDGVRGRDVDTPLPDAVHDHDGFLAHFSVGDFVEVLGLQSASGGRWNGCIGRVVREQEAGRFALEMVDASGGAKLIRPANMRPCASADVLRATRALRRAQPLAAQPDAQKRRVRFAGATASGASRATRGANAAARGAANEEDEAPPQFSGVPRVPPTAPIRALDKALAKSRIASRGPPCGCNSFTCISDQLDWARMREDGINATQYESVRAEACGNVLDRIEPLINDPWYLSSDTPRERRERMAEVLDRESWRPDPESRAARDDEAEHLAFEDARVARLAELRAAHSELEITELRAVAAEYGLFQSGSRTGVAVDDAVGAALANLDHLQAKDGLGDPARPRVHSDGAPSPAARLRALLDAELEAADRRGASDDDDESGDEEQEPAREEERGGGWGAGDGHDAAFDELAAGIAAISGFAGDGSDPLTDFYPLGEGVDSLFALHVELGGESAAAAGKEEKDDGSRDGGGASAIAMEIECGAALSAEEVAQRATLARLYEPARERAHARQVDALD
jgi:hypothetical protein